ncbi:hypothetical protein LptCag_2764 [Leptospirillum ferriphilum]|uniref:Uncharacterized protein n=1 Tax=Leptospirillum ferriphilum TaxID=178606 RepID=A0A094X1X4_9BACT|nr:hypothetical protein LptCag_2764 [Leptospirillum ferriphilum]
MPTPSFFWLGGYFFLSWKDFPSIDPNLYTDFPKSGRCFSKSEIYIGS